jgi:hypothetical protein
MAEHTKNMQVVDPTAVDGDLREAIVYYEFTRRNLAQAKAGMVATLQRLSIEAEECLVRLLELRGGAVIVGGHRYAVAHRELYRSVYLAPGQKCRKPLRQEGD